MVIYSGICLLAKPPPLQCRLCLALTAYLVLLMVGLEQRLCLILCRVCGSRDTHTLINNTQPSAPITNRLGALVPLCVCLCCAACGSSEVITPWGGGLLHWFAPLWSGIRVACGWVMISVLNKPPAASCCAWHEGVGCWECLGCLFLLLAATVGLGCTANASTNMLTGSVQSRHQAATWCCWWLRLIHLLECWKSLGGWCVSINSIS